MSEQHYTGTELPSFPNLIRSQLHIYIFLLAFVVINNAIVIILGIKTSFLKKKEYKKPQTAFIHNMT